jgi:hypothetical protein
MKFGDFFKKFFVILATFLVLAGFWLSRFGEVPVLASRPEIITEYKEAISTTRKKPITLYFHYGQFSQSEEIVNAKIKVTLKGQGLEIVPSTVWDFYYLPKPDQQKPDIPSCNATFPQNHRHKVSNQRSSSKKIDYGPQTASSKKDADSTKDKEASNLKPHHTGCLKFEVRVNNQAKEGGLVEVIFDQDAGQSSSYEESERPGLQIAKFRFAGKNCSSSQVFILDRCRPKCKENQSRKITGACVRLENACEEDQVLFGKECIDKCKQGKVLNGFGECVLPEDIKNCEENGSCQESISEDNCTQEFNNCPDKFKEVSDLNRNVVIFGLVLTIFLIATLITVIIIRRVKE